MEKGNKEENFNYFEQQEIMGGATTPEDIIVERENEKRCVLMGCEDIINQNLGEVIKDKTNSKDVINQAKLLLEMGFKETDYFCQECFWK